MKRVGIYIRVSTEEQARIQDGSLVSQKNRLLEYIEFQNKREPNWGTLVDIYCDEGKSAKDMKGRPEFLRLLNDIKLGRIELILATELSRFNRNIRDFCEVWDLIKKHKASFVTLREQFDTTTASGEMMVFNLINYAQYERKQTSERIAANWHSRSKRGLFNGGTIPLGYDRNPKSKGELIVNPDEAQVVRKIFNMFLENESLRKTQIALIQQGIFNKKYTNKHGIEKGGKIFVIDTLYSLLTNKTYLGLKEIKHKDGSSEVIKAVRPAIIDEELFERVRSRLSQNKTRYKPESCKTYPFPLTELIYCGECGKTMGGKSGTGRSEKHYYYGHSQKKNPLEKDQGHQCQIKNIRAPRLEEVTLKSLKSLLTNKDLIRHWVEIYRNQSVSELPEVQMQMNKLEMEAQTTTKRISNLVQRIADLPPEVPADAFYEQVKQMSQSLNNLKLAKENLKTKEIDLQGQEVDEDAFVQKLEKAIATLELVPVEKQRSIFTSLIKFIEIEPMRIKMGLYAPTKSSNRTGSRNVGNGASGRN